MFKIKLLLCSILLINFVNAEDKVSKTKKIFRQRAEQTVSWIKNHKTTAAAGFVLAGIVAICAQAFIPFNKKTKIVMTELNTMIKKFFHSGLVN